MRSPAYARYDYPDFGADVQLGPLRVPPPVKLVGTPRGRLFVQATPGKLYGLYNNSRSSCTGATNPIQLRLYRVVRAVQGQLLELYKLSCTGNRDSGWCNRHGDVENCLTAGSGGGEGIPVISRLLRTQSSSPVLQNRLAELAA